MPCKVVFRVALTPMWRTRELTMRDMFHYSLRKNTHTAWTSWTTWTTWTPQPDETMYKCVWFHNTPAVNSFLFNLGLLSLSPVTGFGTPPCPGSRTNRKRKTVKVLSPCCCCSSHHSATWYRPSYEYPSLCPRMTRTGELRAQLFFKARLPDSIR